MKMKILYSTKELIKFYDCDPAGILFFANIFKLAHSTLESYLTSKYNYFSHNKWFFLIKDCSANYFAPISLGTTVNIELFSTQIRSKGFSLYYAFLSENGQLLAEVKTVHICADRETKIPSNIPEDLLKYL